MPARWFTSSVAKKLGMALTGMVLYGFLAGHLVGNLLILRHDRAASFNTYSEYLINHPMLVPVELFLLASLVVHTYLAIRVSIENRRARPVDYAQRVPVGGRNWANRSMIYSGVVVAVFLVLHLKAFKYGDRSGGALSDLVARYFSQPYYVLWYVVAMIILGFHLWHSFQSAFQTLGVGGQKVRPIGAAVCIGLAAGFGLLPLYIMAAK